MSLRQMNKMEIINIIDIYICIAKKRKNKRYVINNYKLCLFNGIRIIFVY